MLTRNQVILRGLFVGVLVGIAASGVMIWQQRSLPPPPEFPLRVPETVSWANRSVTRLADGTERRLVEAFAADGKNFRLEVGLPERRPIVWVYDGRRVAVSDPVPERAVADLDPRNTILNAYESLPAFRYRGIKKIGKHDCWVFEQKVAGLRSRFWIDEKKRIPRQVIIEYPDGRKDTQTYVDLPAHRTHQPGLYDPSRLTAMLINGAEAIPGVR